MGRASGVRKSINAVNVLLMRVKNEAELNLRRRQYRSDTTDHGVEAMNPDMPKSILPGKEQEACVPTNLDSYLYPYCIGILDSLHILWGGYEDTLKASPVWKQFNDVLVARCTSTSDKQCMRKMQSIVSEVDAGSAKIFSTRATIHIDWRWETMNQALDLQVPLDAPLKKFFDKNKMLSKDGPGLLSASAIRNLDEALKTMPEFEEQAEAYRVLGKCIERLAGVMEICDCHWQLWQARNG